MVAAGKGVHTGMCQLFSALNCESLLFKSCYCFLVHHACNSCTLTCKVLAKFQCSWFGVDLHIPAGGENY